MIRANARYFRRKLVAGCADQPERGLGFCREDRDENVRRIGFVARLLARNGVVVLVSAISPYRQSRDDVRRALERDEMRFVEVFVRAPLEVLIGRDVKGLYKKALAGEIPNFTGISDPYEEPEQPALVVDSSAESVSESTERLLSFLRRTAALDNAEQAQSYPEQTIESVDFQPIPEGY